MTKEQKKERRWYKFMFIIAWIPMHVLFPCRMIGVENFPDGPAILCPSHSNLQDPFYISLALGIKRFCHHMAKEDTRKIPFLGYIMYKMGSIFVDRDEQDINAYKKSIRVLQAGEQLMVFPEGTRVRGNDYVAPKTGVIRMAAKTHVPIVPIYLPRDKKVFRRTTFVIGEPYYLENARRDEYEKLACELMDKIWALKERAV